MMIEMLLRLVWVTTVTFLMSPLVVPSLGNAQETQPTANEPPANTEEGRATAGVGGDGAAGTEGDATEGPTEAASDAKRVVRIRRVIALDRERINWLRRELRERTRWFEELAQAMEQVRVDRNRLTSKLAALRTEPNVDPRELQSLEEELSELNENLDIVDTQTDLALQAERIIRDQLQELEKKVEHEELAVGRLTGNIEVEDAAASHGAGTGAGRTLPPGVGLGTPQPDDGDAAPASTEGKKRSRTAAQLAAQRELEEAERELQVAKIDFEDFVARKQALQKQIEFERSLSEGDTKERENIRRALETLETRLRKYRQTGARRKVQRAEASIRQLSQILQEGDRSATRRADYIDSLLTRLKHLEEAELRITENVEAADEAEDEARQKVKWLESPLHPSNIASWAKERGPRMLLVVLAALTLLLFIHFSARAIARTVVRRKRGERGDGTGRADTLAFSFRSLTRVLIVIFAALLVLQEAGVDIKTVLGGAAILGVAFAFGAQDLMKDYFSGFLILLEDQYQLGDLVTINSVTGTVESVNMRVTVLRDLEGRVHFMPNGNIDHVTNRTYAWGRPVFEIPVRFDEDIDRVMVVLIEIAHGLSKDPSWKGAIIGEPDMLGVDKVTESGVVVKFMVKTQPDQLFPVRREMLRRIVKRFAELGIQITVPHRILVGEGVEGGPL